MSVSISDDSHSVSSCSECEKVEVLNLSVQPIEEKGKVKVTRGITKIRFENVEIDMKVHPLKKLSSHS